MSTQTPNLGLTKPAGNEKPQVSVINGNMDILDSAVVKSRCWYGQCDTGESVAAKVVTCSGFELVKGAMIAVHFSYTNTADDATMNVNSTGAKAIATGNTISGQDNFWYAGEIVMFTYDGTYWRPANMAGINALRDSVYLNAAHFFYSDINTVMQAQNSQTICRIILNLDGVIGVWRSTDGGSSWTNVKNL